MSGDTVKMSRDITGGAYVSCFRHRQFIPPGLDEAAQIKKTQSVKPRNVRSGENAAYRAK